MGRRCTQVDADYLYWTLAKIATLAANPGLSTGSGQHKIAGNRRGMFLRGRSGVETQAENSLLRKAFLRSYARRPTRSRGEELPNRHRMPNSRTVSAAVSLTASAMGPRCARLPPSFWVSLGLSYIIPLITKIANVKFTH